MARPTWSGYLSFGLVTVPVKLYSAVRTHDVHFRQLHETTHARVRRKRVDEQTGEEVPYDEIVKGYPLDGDRYVVVDPDELEQLDPDARRTIDIHDFVELAQIDPIYYDRPYYLAPADEAAFKAYDLLVEAMQRSAKVAIAKFVMRNKEYLAAIRARDDVLLLSTMNYADEVADPAEIEGVEDRTREIGEREVAMAEQLIESLTTDFQPAHYHDEYQERLVEYLEAKAEGEEVTVKPPPEEPGGVVDLMEALEASLGRRRDRSDREDRYADLTRDELYELAQQRDIPGRSAMSKDELTQALRDTDPDQRAAS
ncbi:MAG TPA: Ku protein [Nitriliruptorales bacterium]|nr:Ku protein [Nitriliruptorales bacterium]